ncbi:MULTISPECIES: 3',5'-cyclic-AMP phosphodiesterase [Pantoea]|uniref:3',5'-cyclic adenosine monophosphate phosphodiesterase CpdA n=1 Tax=Pantoea stewartii subsp. stewartii DC283 TaxID=660596 RepID=H3RA01_PANSE|nr:MULTISPECIES: 3',5'-cyclic-AMP phosphodiesterase [Pantoea]ARF51458.1 3',5'-cyclic-AMP phosphodiesterase [Pantoea stewartii subsp. stewartii DC283]EHU02014.1 cyclic 3',5'-adenosine monophosphate phosphodiesterase [Pantoea stewartii subsp. stewartii DC283]KAB0559784.1 3',5'-cyclic-AMP phosphodiesterase [Pantoea stewartii subsp. stewartii]MDF7786446.1 3',5'-cyclic-AMP phosphodiesterase [Pantoea stewartii]MEB6536182.1 3',5'-cyclic-AMP phosphodiesterase [Pantoea stewartii]
MDSLLTLPATTESEVRILQVTDTHLFAGKHESLLGVNTWASYDAVLDAIIAQQRDYDLIVATGDLSQDHSVEAYQHFVEGISRLPKPCVWLPGNHDFQPAMVDTLAEAGINAHKHVLLGEHWQVVLLDSQVFGVPHGMLSDYQLEWLNTTLARYPQRHTLVLLHHHPLASGCTWLDQHSLRNPHQLDAVLQHYPLAKTLVCGHIHQEMDVPWQGRRVLATPSTCVQFKPHCTSFTIDTVAPGWRWFTLHNDGQLETEVNRLTTQAFRPDLDAEGY